MQSQSVMNFISYDLLFYSANTDQNPDILTHYATFTTILSSLFRRYESKEINLRLQSVISVSVYLLW